MFGLIPTPALTDSGSLIVADSDVLILFVAKTLFICN